VAISGYRVFTNFMGTPAACAVALALPYDLPKTDWQFEYQEPTSAVQFYRGLGCDCDG
jgi:hypothetical protein